MALAPSARRRPYSRIRCRTENVNTPKIPTPTRRSATPANVLHTSPEPEAVEAVRILINVLCDVVQHLTGNILVKRIDRLAVLQPYRFETRGS